MKKIAIVAGVLLATLLFATTAMAADNVLLADIDFGGDDGYAGTLGWGRSVTDETGGSYGGIGDYGCRLVWDIAPPDGTNDAYFMLPTPQGSAQSLTIRHLDGIADDSFTVEVQAASGAWIDVGSYANYYTTETWVTTPFDLSPFSFGRGTNLTFRITATGTQWSGFDTYGQLCIDKVELYGNGKPR